jgi:ferric-dicitrate binding protein FerR (iron transport regulator)
MQHRGTWRAAVAAILWAGAAPAGAEPVGFLALVDPPVERRAGASGSFTAAAIDQEVSVGDAIRTGREGLAKLVIGDDTTLTIDEESEVEIDRWLVGGAAAGAEPSRIELLSGHVRTVVAEKFGGRSRLELITPTSVIGVKGTEWLTWWLAPQFTTWVCVVSGVVAASGRDLADPGTIDVGAGQCARIQKGETPEIAPPPPGLEAVGNARSGEALGEGGGETPPPPPNDDPDRPVITGDDNVGREFDIPEPEPPPPPPEPEPEPQRDRDQDPYIP